LFSKLSEAQIPERYITGTIHDDSLKSKWFNQTCRCKAYNEFYLNARLPGIFFSYHFYQLSFVHEDGLVLDFCRRDPSLNLISKPLQLLDLFLEILFIFFFLIRVWRIVNFLPSLFKFFDTFGYFLQTAVYLRWKETKQKYWYLT